MQLGGKELNQHMLISHVTAWITAWISTAGNTISEDGQGVDLLLQSAEHPNVTDSL